MSHPYSGAASYIYANEYRTPSENPHGPLTGYDKQPARKLYNDYRYTTTPDKRVTIDLQVKSARPDLSAPGPTDPTRVTLGHRKRAKISRQGITSPATATIALSPASQVSSLPSQTTSTSRTSHSHSRNNSGQPHKSTITPTTTTTTTSSNDPFGSQSQSYYPPKSIDYIYIDPKDSKQPKPTGLRLNKFKLTLPNPFRHSSSSSSSASVSPWPPPHTPILLNTPAPKPKRPNSPIADIRSSNWTWSTGPRSTLSRLLSTGRNHLNPNSNPNPKSKSKSKPKPKPLQPNSTSKHRPASISSPRSPTRSRSQHFSRDNNNNKGSLLFKSTSSSKKKRGRSLRFGSGRRAEKDLNFSMVSV